MNTPAHLIFSAAAFARPDRRNSLYAALLGALAPDLSLYVLAGWHIVVLGTSADIVFRELYFSEQWQAIFAVDNSFFVWGLVFALASYRQWFLLRIFSASALLHLAFDFPFHAGDGRPHFWPITDWVFHSPISYWDNDHLGWILGPLELGLCAALTVVLVRRYQSVLPRLVIAGLLLLEVGSSGVWLLMF